MKSKKPKRTWSDVESSTALAFRRLIVALGEARLDQAVSADSTLARLRAAKLRAWRALLAAYPVCDSEGRPKPVTARARERYKRRLRAYLAAEKAIEKCLKAVNAGEKNARHRGAKKVKSKSAG